jgi:hypothetical protein
MVVAAALVSWVISDLIVGIIDKLCADEVQSSSRISACRNVAFEIALVAIGIVFNSTTGSRTTTCVDLAATLEQSSKVLVLELGEGAAKLFPPMS